MAEAPLKTDLILRGRVARRPVTFVGTMEGEALTQIAGCVTLHASLSSILDDLGANYREAAEVLKQLVGSDDLVLEKLGAVYHGGKSKSVQVGLSVKIGNTRCQFALLKRLGKEGGIIAGLDLRSDKLALPNNFLSGLIGDISIGNLGVYYSNQAFNDVSFSGDDAFRDAAQFTLGRLKSIRVISPRELKSPRKFLSAASICLTLWRFKMRKLKRPRSQRRQAASRRLRPTRPYLKDRSTGSRPIRRSGR